VDVNAKAQVAPILHSRFEHIFDNAERGTEHAVPLRVDPIATQLRFDLNAEPPDAIMAPERALAILHHAAACRDLPQGSRILSTVAPQLLNATVPLAVCAAFRDAVLAMYHDQGLIPVKLLGLDHGVNTTLGLPFVRTSPDHGTAFDLAGTGLASAASLLAAIDAARAVSN
jgi:hypothetical protein